MWLKKDGERMRCAVTIIGCLVFALGCDSPVPKRTAVPEKVQKSPSKPKVEAPPKTDDTLPSFSNSTFRAPGRVVAIGDLHGDLEATRSVLRLAGAIDDADKWIGGELTVVQTGDQLDRGDKERAILDLLASLSEQATKTGGALHVLNGNHETMNARGDFRYVTAGGFQEFEGSDIGRLPKNALEMLPAHTRARAAALFPGGRYAKQLAQQPIVIIVGDTVFAHGGVVHEHMQYGIDRMNTEVRKWLLGRGVPPQVVLSPEGPVWTRLYSDGTPSKRVCEELERVLSVLGVKRMVVGHTVQMNGANSACDNRVWRIDVGMSAHYGGTHVEALSIADGEVKLLRQEKGHLDDKKRPSAAARTH